MTDRDIAQGRWQKRLLKTMTTQGYIENPVRHLRGSSRLFITHYQQSFNHLLERMREAGYKIRRRPGPKGGEWSAIYYLVATPNKDNHQ